MHMITSRGNCRQWVMCGCVYSDRGKCRRAAPIAREPSTCRSSPNTLASRDWLMCPGCDGSATCRESRSHPRTIMRGPPERCGSPSYTIPHDCNTAGQQPCLRLNMCVYGNNFFDNQRLRLTRADGRHFFRQATSASASSTRSIEELPAARTLQRPWDKHAPNQLRRLLPKDDTWRS